MMSNNLSLCAEAEHLIQLACHDVGVGVGGGGSSPNNTGGGGANVW